MSEYPVRVCSIIVLLILLATSNLALSQLAEEVGTEETQRSLATLESLGVSVVVSVVRDRDKVMRSLGGIPAVYHFKLVSICLEITLQILAF